MRRWCRSPPAKRRLRARIVGARLLQLTTRYDKPPSFGMSLRIRDGCSFRELSTVSSTLCGPHLLRDGELANALAGSGVDRIGESRHHARGTRLTDTARCFAVLHE